MKRLFFCFFLLVSFTTIAQVRSKSASEILQDIKKLNTIGSVLYIAAHPDDENTRLIAYLSQEKHLRTGYLSLTRGDGGQNLIGTEFGEGLGVIRTQELLEARKRDGGEQFFSRAVDFGFSKTFDETLNFWEREKVLADIVWVIRKFKPDVIITRFPPDARAGHGHHASSAILGAEAFAKAGDAKAFPEQLKSVAIHQAKRLYFNTGSFFLKSEDLEKSDLLRLDVGAYNALLGKSVNEIAAESRSQHKSQGFGVSLARGSQIEYFQYVAGEKASKDLFEGIDLTWTRLKGGANISQQLTAIEKNFDVNTPEKSIPALTELYKILKTGLLTSSDSFILNQKLTELEKIILACAGLYAEAVSESYTAVIGEKTKVKVNLIVRSDFRMTLKSLTVNHAIENPDTVFSQELSNNKVYSYNLVFDTGNRQISQPYWLTKPYKALYQVDSQELIGLPENLPTASVACTFTLPNNENLMLELPVQYKWTDRVEGEQFRPFIITPPLTANLSSEVLIFKDRQDQNLEISLLSHQKNLQGRVKIDLPQGWKSEPESVEFSLVNKEQAKKIAFKISATNPFQKTESGLTSSFKVLFKLNTPNSWEEAFSWQVIDYKHITKQIIMNPAKGKLIPIDLKITDKKIAYIMGAGDEVPGGLRQIGFDVTDLPAAKILETDLSQFACILLGIRAYNTEAGLVSGNEKLLEYVKNGGKLIVQYNTNGDLLLPQIAPYKITFSRNRVTEENSSVTFLEANHPLLIKPNKLIDKDFDGWVQERGLYFAQEWADDFKPLLAWSDKGETPQKGGLLVANYGKGVYIFTGISFFRQLPAGVSGAYRLLANIISF
ncbi:MAG: PIG-L family deacetylase [Verrucomicrobia bacterium]|nr:PIG-L family deacetylase [Cytophagales bacterium]